MSRIGKSELVYGTVMSFDEILSEIERVDSRGIQEVAGELLAESPTLAIVGPFKSASPFERLI
jgi:predicted Zn-dependent peptidase